MKDSAETGGGKHAAKHGREPTEVDAERVTIKFGPEVTRYLVELEHAVRGKKDFDSDVFALLQRLSSGKPLGLENALTNLAMVMQGAAEYAEKTGDREAGLALCNVTAHLIGQSPDAKPVTVFVEPKARVR